MQCGAPATAEAPGSFDEWLQARHALSIAIFSRAPCSSVDPLPRLDASQTASSGGIEHSEAFVCHSSIRGYGERSSSIHRCGGCARWQDSSRDPLIDLLRQSEPPRLPEDPRGWFSRKFSILSASATCSHASSTTSLGRGWLNTATERLRRVRGLTAGLPAGGANPRWRDGDVAFPNGCRGSILRTSTRDASATGSSPPKRCRVWR